MLLPIWRQWLKMAETSSVRRRPFRNGIRGCTAFDYAEKIGAVKVLDASNSHPTSFHGFWQRELDIWNPGAQVGVPRRSFASINREIERADVVLCASTYVRDSMLYNGIPEAKLSVNPYGADLRVFTPRQRLPDKPRFIFVGALTLRKGLQYLIPAFEQAKKDMPEAELILCGGLYPDFQELYNRWRTSFTHIRSLPHPRTGEAAAILHCIHIPIDRVKGSPA